MVEFRARDKMSKAPWRLPRRFRMPEFLTESRLLPEACACSNFLN